MNRNQSLSRRAFLQASGAASAAATFAPALTGLAATGAQAADIPLSPGPCNKWPGRVVLNYNTALQNYTGVSLNPWSTATDADKALLKKMVDDSATAAEAWRAIFPDTVNANSKIAIKIQVNDPLVIKAVVDGLISMNVGTIASPAHISSGNITLWQSVSLTEYTPTANDIAGGVNNFNNMGFTAANFPGVNLIGHMTNAHAHTGADAGALNGAYADPLYECDFLINATNMRPHFQAAHCVTMGFKNHYGTYHPYGTTYTPAIAGGNAHDWTGGPQFLRDINCTGPVYKKTVLMLFTAFFNDYGFGPWYNYAKQMDPSVETADTNAQKKINANSIFLSTDPVAAESYAFILMGRNGIWPSGAYGTQQGLAGYVVISSGTPGGDGIGYNIGISDEAKMTQGEIINNVITKPIDHGTGISGDKVIATLPELRLFPNPANSYCYIDFLSPKGLTGKSALVEIYDMLGRVAWSRKCPLQGVGNRVIWKGTDNRGRAVSNGRYLVNVTMGAKVLKQVFSLAR
jgi:hypothetical protein